MPLLGAVAVLGGALFLAKAERSPRVPVSPLIPPIVRAPRAPYDPTLVHKMLVFYAAQTRSDPGNAIARAQLAGEYLESYRETGDSADALRAEQAARASLKIHTRRNSAAWFQLSRALLTQHRFPEALKAAREAARQDPIGFRECADIEIELGDYDDAKRDMMKSPGRGEDPAFLALASRLNELRGDSKGQLALLSRAAKQADDNPEIPVQTVAWFHERLGRCLGMMGRLDEAEQSYREGLRVFPRDYRTMAALAHLSAARGNWKQSIQWGQKAAEIVPAPETLALLGDGYEALGQRDKAAAQFRLVEEIGALSRAQGVIYDRQRALYYADHGRNLEEAVTLARGELRFRHDIYTFDTLAWTLFKAGRLSEAEANSKRALAFGTRDASLWFHAGMIAAAQNKTALARTYLSRALEINPFFHPSQPAQARETLARLNGSATS